MKGSGAGRKMPDDIAKQGAPLFKGFGYACGTIAVSLLLPAAQQFHYFAILLAFAAGIYVGFAIVDNEHREYFLEWVVALLFSAFGFLGLWLTPLLISLGWALHALWDLLHHLKELKTRTTGWYPPVCLAFDLTVAWYVFYLWVLES